jgi:hypothetical protein
MPSAHLPLARRHLWLTVPQALVNGSRGSRGTRAKMISASSGSVECSARVVQRADFPEPCQLLFWQACWLPAVSC